MPKADPQTLYDNVDEMAVRAESTAGRLDGAFGKLEAALSRLEQAATLRSPADAEMLKLRLENAALRDTVCDALGQVDALLADMNGDD